MNHSHVTQVSLDDITPILLGSILSHYFQDDVKVKTISAQRIKGGLITELVGGIFRLIPQYDTEKRSILAWPSTIVLKANPSDETLYKRMQERARAQGVEQLVRLMPNLGFSRREVMSYRELPSHITLNMPTTFGTVFDESENRLWIFMEDLADITVLHEFGHAQEWEGTRLQRVIGQLAEFHAKYWTQVHVWDHCDWLNRYPNNILAWCEYVYHASLAMADNHWKDAPRTRLALAMRLVELLPSILSELNSMPLTLIHGDCSPRNFGFRTNPSEQIIFFDWALTGIRVAQHDLEKFLLYIYDPFKSIDHIRWILDVYINNLEKLLGLKIDRFDFYRGFDYASMFALSVQLTACAWRAHTKENDWLFQWLERRLGYLDQALSGSGVGNPL